MSKEVTSEDRERVRLLGKISSSRHGFKQLTLEELKLLEKLIGKKDYSHNKKANRSKVKLLTKINVRIYELEEGEGIFK